MEPDDKDAADGDRPESSPPTWVSLFGRVAQGSANTGLGAVSAATEPVTEALGAADDVATGLTEDDTPD